MVFGNIIKKIKIKKTTKKTPNNKNFKKYKKQKLELYDLYDEEVQKLQNNNNIYYININSYINKAIQEMSKEIYLYNDIHPNNNYGVKLYTYSLFRE